ncbi:30S ribosomal protein S12 methylthiotransferase RimO [Motiliproteus sp.]|uniref:30S ribosomal protein S12 methylthiotransferase RimO n=1 Tax=Motiliproteus sp. TaxID=1898955 RepID=UPI003BAC2BFD
MTDNHNPKVGFVSLGCPKALVDSERILTQLKLEGYDLVNRYDDADVVVVNTCGFIDAAKQESLDAIGEAINENGKVIVTGCMGADAEAIREVHPQVLSVSGPEQYEQVVEAVHEWVPPKTEHDPFVDLVPPQGVKLTPRHYAYLKISEGCNHSCSFCIIPSMRGKLVSRPVGEVLKEAEGLVRAGVKELLVVSQDTGAYGLDTRYKLDMWDGRPVKTRLREMAEAMGKLGIWVRLHYLYPYPHIDDLIPLMAEGLILPYLDIPFQHASPRILKLMKRPASSDNILQRIADWRAQCPSITIRSTFIVGFPGETEEDFQELLDFLEAAQLDRVGCFQYSPVEGAPANDLGLEEVPDEIKQQRWERLMELQQQISEARQLDKIGQTIEVIIDEVGDDGACGRSKADSPDIDGNVYLEGATHLQPGNIVKAVVIDADAYDLWGELTESDD